MAQPSLRIVNKQGTYLFWNSSWVNFKQFSNFQSFDFLLKKILKHLLIKDGRLLYYNTKNIPSNISSYDKEYSQYMRYKKLKLKILRKKRKKLKAPLSFVGNIWFLRYNNWMIIMPILVRKRFYKKNLFNYEKNFDLKTPIDYTFNLFNSLIFNKKYHQFKFLNRAVFYPKIRSPYLLVYNSFLVSIYNFHAFFFLIFYSRKHRLFSRFFRRIKSIRSLIYLPFTKIKNRRFKLNKKLVKIIKKKLKRIKTINYIC